MAKTPMPEQPTLAYELHGNCYLNITYHCTLRCAFCPKFNGTWEVQNYDLRLPAEPTVEQVLQAIGKPERYREIVFCGLGEPTRRLDVLLAVARTMKDAGKPVRVNTDGLANLVHGRDVVPELAEVVDTVSISMNAQDASVYERHTRPTLEGAFPAMLDFAARARDAGIDVSLTAIDGLEGVDMDACRAIAEELGVGFRRRVLDVVG